MKKQRGSAILEFALSATVLVAFFAGVFQVGYTFYAFNALEHAVRTGAQFASDKGADASADAIRSEVVKAAGGLNGLTNSNVQVVVNRDPAGGSPVSVTVSITSYRINSVFSSTMLNGRPNATFPYTHRAPDDKGQ